MPERKLEALVDSLAKLRDGDVPAVRPHTPLGIHPYDGSRSSPAILYILPQWYPTVGTHFISYPLDIMVPDETSGWDNKQESGTSLTLLASCGPQFFICYQTLAEPIPSTGSEVRVGRQPS